MTLLDALADIADALGDYSDRGGPLSFIRWRLETLANFVHEARCTIATVHRRREHAAVLDILMPAGEVHDLTAYGARIIRIMEVRYGSEVRQRVTETTAGKRDWGALWPTQIKPEPAWAPEQFRVVKIPGADTIVTVSPPIPEAQKYTLRVLMEGVPPARWELTDTVDTCTHWAAIRHYVMGAAYGMQVESPGAVASARAHMDEFRALMTGSRQADTEAARAAA